MSYHNVEESVCLSPVVRIEVSSIIHIIYSEDQLYMMSLHIDAANLDINICSIAN